MCCGSIQHIASSLRSNYCRGSLGMMGLSISSCSIVSGKNPLFCVVSSGRINLVFCLTLLRDIRCLGAKKG